MDKIVEQTLLYDFYGELLTEHQRKIYEEYFLNDLSLSEIAEQEGVTRQGIHDLLKRCGKLLKNYEAKLHLVEKFLENKQRVNQIYEKTQQILEKDADVALKNQIIDIQDIAKSILDEL